ncbi:ATP-dependent zinc metalloprotease FtsH [Myxococcota bacterium]|nr:ATP-dependent zinc metalloprotease FtsH [Myxococcota bacterium]
MNPRTRPREPWSGGGLDPLDPPGGAPAPDRQRRRVTLWTVLIGLALLLLLQWAGGEDAAPEVAYSQFRDWVEADHVESVRVDGLRVGAEAREAAPEEVPRRFRTVALSTDDLAALLRGTDVEVRARPGTGGWESLAAWMLPLLLLVGFWVFVLRRMNPGGQVMGFGRNRARIVPERGTGITFDQVAGLDEAKAELEEVVSFLRDPHRYTDLGAAIPAGVLLVGPPGTGKTLLARAVAGEAGVPFFIISGSEFVEMFVGVGASRVRDLFQQAKARAPCIVFIDELDALGKSRAGAGALVSNEEREQTLNQLLVELDGFDGRGQVILIAATNRPEVLDPALLRPGRFDRRVVIDRPDLHGRREILEVHARKVKLGPGVDLGAIASATPGLAGADLANIVNEAALLAGRRKAGRVGQDELQEAVERVVAGLERRSRRLTAGEKRRVAFHEAGHAVVADAVGDPNPVQKVSIIPRSSGALGFTMQLPTEDRFLMSRQELHQRLTTLLGGRAAEEVVFGDPSTGASDDLQRATAIARRMVVDFGLSERLGPIAFGGGEDDDVGRRLAGLRPERWSDETAAAIDREIGEIVGAAHARAEAALRARRGLLDRVADRLLEAETLDGAEFRALVAAWRDLAPDNGRARPQGGPGVSGVLPPRD